MPTVEDVVKENCRETHVTFKPVRKPHGDCTQLVYGTGGPGGICCALSLLWLSRYFKNEMDNDRFYGSSFGDLVSLLDDQPGLVRQVTGFFGNLLSNTPQAPTAGQKLAGELKTIQEGEVARSAAIKRALVVLNDDSLGEEERVNHFNNVTKLTGYKALYRESMASLGIPNVKFVNDPATKTNFYSLKDETPPFQRAIEFMTGQSGASLIKFQNHYVAVISDTRRPKYKFLDVNGGQAITTEVADFKGFLETFLKGPVGVAYTKLQKLIQVTMARI